MTLRSFASIGILLLLAGCSLPPASGQTNDGGVRPLVDNVGSGLDFKTQMNEVANDYAGALSWNAPEHVNYAVESCYSGRGNGAFIGRFGYEGARQCLALDYAAYKDNQIATHHYRLPGNPYFSREAAAQRWGIYGPRAGFDNADSMMQYMRGSYAFVKPDQLNITNSRRGISVIPPKGAHLPSLIAP